MKLFWFFLLVACVEISVDGAVPQLTDFNTTQFGTAGGIVTIKSGALLTNVPGIGWRTNGTGQIQMIVNTNVVSVETHMSATNGSNTAALDGVTVVEDPAIMNNVGGTYTAIFEDTGIAVTNVTWSYGLAAENYIAATNSGPQFEDEVHGAYGIDGVVFGGGVFSVNAWATTIPGAGYGVQGFGYSGYRFQAGVQGGCIPTGLGGQTNLGVLGYVSFAGAGDTNVGVYGGSRASNVDLPSMVSAGGLFDAGPNGDAALVARKYDGSQSFEVTAAGVTHSKFGRIINRFATATNYTLTVANHYLVSTATQTNTLPAANAVAAGQIFIIKNKAGTTTVRPAGADTIDGVAADDVLAAQASNTYISDGVSNWEKN